MGEKPECFSYAHKLQRYGQKGSEKMSESKQTRRDVIDAELQKTKAELATLDDDRVKDILNMLFSDLSFRRTMQNILAEKENHNLRQNEII